MPIVSKAKEKGKRGNDVVAVAGIDGCLQSASNTFVRQVAAEIDRIPINEVCAGMFLLSDVKTRAAQPGNRICVCVSAHNFSFIMPISVMCHFADVTT